MNTRELAVKAAYRDFTSPAWSDSRPKLIDVRENDNLTWSMLVTCLAEDGLPRLVTEWYRIQTAFCWVT